jgi:hypothetical protein
MTTYRFDRSAVTVRQKPQSGDSMLIGQHASPGNIFGAEREASVQRETQQ